jgi:hypothetical protein
MKLIALVAAALALSGCSSLKVSQVDPKTGYLAAASKATTVKNTKFDLDSRKTLLLVTDDRFVVDQMKTLGYFDEVISGVDLEKAIIAGGLTDKVISVRERIGLSNAAKYYKSFLWLRFNLDDQRPNYVRMFLTDPLTMEDLFSAEIFMDRFWTGVNDQYTWYPLFNELISYIRANSATFGKAAP